MRRDVIWMSSTQATASPGMWPGHNAGMMPLHMYNMYIKKGINACIHINDCNGVQFTLSKF